MLGLIRKAKMLLQQRLSNPENESYSQCGEDRIVHFLFAVMGIDRPTYLDIGAHHPIRYSNTYLFYRMGCAGVLVEPNGKYCEQIRRWRPRDVCLNVGVSSEKRIDVPYYEMSSDTLNTFSRESADRMVAECGATIQEVRTLDVLTPEEIIAAYCGGAPNLLSLDVEGLELEVLGAIDLRNTRPQVICVETLTYANDGSGKKIPEVNDFLCSYGYTVYADTRINTIFVDEEYYRSRFAKG